MRLQGHCKLDWTVSSNQVGQAQLGKPPTCAQTSQPPSPSISPPVQLASNATTKSGRRIEVSAPRLMVWDGGRKGPETVRSGPRSTRVDWRVPSPKVVCCKRSGSLFSARDVDRKASETQKVVWPSRQVRQNARGLAGRPWQRCPTIALQSVSSPGDPSVVQNSSLTRPDSGQFGEGVTPEEQLK